MWKLIIVEDEPVVRRTIRHKIDWQHFGFEIAGEAENGEDALQLIRELNPDAVIADIVMPLMDGIELLKQARIEGWECRFLMLTCMNEFEYARQALEYGASAYVLKLSMDVKSLGEAMMKIRTELEGRADIRKLQLRSKLLAGEHGLPVLWDRMYGTPGIPETRNAADSPPLTGLDYIWLCVFLSNSSDLCIEEVQRYGFAGDVIPDGLIPFTRLGVTTVVAFSDRILNWEVPLHREIKTTDYAAVFTRSVPATELSAAWSKLLRAADRSWYENRRGIEYVDISAPGGTDIPQLTWAFEKELLRDFEQSKRDACMRTLEAMWEEMRALQYPAVMAKSFMLRLDHLFSRIAEAPAMVADELAEAAFFSDLKNVCAKRVQAYLHHMALSQEHVTDHAEVNKMMRYIHQNYDAPITLKSMAQYIAMEEHYVSRLFKRKVGESFIHYLQQYRVNKAEVYLRESDMSVGEVGRCVGFANDNYFSKIFKRTTGVTPGEYRKRASQRDKSVL